jgi:mono/diheme cytochrome c family protein
VPTLEELATGNVEQLVEASVSRIDGEKWPGVHTPAARSMTDREIAALLTYVRNSWGNDASAVQPAEVGNILEEMGRNP